MNRAGPACLMIAFLFILVVSLAADAQQAGKVYPIGVLNPGTHTRPSMALEAFREHLRE